MKPDVWAPCIHWVSHELICIPKVFKSQMWGQNWVMPQNNGPKHSCKSTLTVKRLQWPSQSPDLKLNDWNAAEGSWESCDAVSSMNWSDVVKNSKPKFRHSNMRDRQPCRKQPNSLLPKVVIQATESLRCTYFHSTAVKSIHTFSCTGWSPC